MLTDILVWNIIEPEDSAFVEIPTGNTRHRLRARSGRVVSRGTLHLLIYRKLNIKVGAVFASMRVAPRAKQRMLVPEIILKR